MRQILADPNVLSNYGISEEVKFEVIAKANKLLHSKGFKQLPMHDSVSLHRFSTPHTHHPHNPFQIPSNPFQPCADAPQQG